MSNTSVKIAISVPRQLFSLVERCCKSARVSRSSLIAQALREWMSRGQRAATLKQYAAGYRRRPETLDDAALANRVAALADAADEEWE